MKYWIEASYGNITRRIKLESKYDLETMRNTLCVGASTSHTYWVFDNTIKNTADNQKRLSGINLSRADEILVYPL